MTAPLTYAERVAVARLHAMLELLPTELDKRLSAAGITAFEHTLLDALAQNPQHFMRTSELARKTNATLPRISRVVTSLERKGFIERVACPEDKRATNVVLTPQGEKTHEHSTALYASAVRELVLEGLDTLPGDGVAQLTDLTFAILTSLDTSHSGGTWNVDEKQSECKADPESDLAAESEPACAADPEPVCAADPEPECAADPVPESCPADPVQHIDTVSSRSHEEDQVRRGSSLAPSRQGCFA